MTKEEAIAALELGNKLTHRHFSSKEYVFLANGRMYFEDWAHMSTTEFWSLRSGDSWKDDWDIFTNYKND